MMRKGLFAICSVLLLVILSIALLGPGCTGGPTTGTIEVKATLCGDPWEGAVNYELTGPGATAPTVITGTQVAKSFTVDVGDWSCAYADDGSGPAGAYFVGIEPSSPQTVAANQGITFTLKFELDQDAWIEFDTWTVDGDPGKVYYEMGEYWAEVHLCQVLDVHFLQGVKGCEEVVAAVNETSTLQITQIFNPPGLQVYVVNNDCAVNKTVEQAPEPDKGEQVPSFNGIPVDPEKYFDLPPEGVTLLDVETEWWLTKCLNYTKSINWFGVSLVEPWQHDCVLFELIVPAPGIYVFTLVASAEVELVDDEDVDTANNKAESPPLNLTVIVP
jgi:hypothetical protein